MTTEKKLLALVGLGVGYIAYDKLATNNKENATRLLNTWMKNVNSQNVDNVVNLYSEDAVLLPTLTTVYNVGYTFEHQYPDLPTGATLPEGSYIAQGKNKIRIYMNEFLALDSLKGKIYPKTIVFTQLSMNKFVVDGMYAFTYNHISNEQLIYTTQFARYTFIFARKPLSNEWLITNQNSNKAIAYNTAG